MPREIINGLGRFNRISGRNIVPFFSETDHFIYGIAVAVYVFGKSHGRASPVGAHTAWFNRSHFYTQRCDFFSNGFAETGQAEFCSMINRQSGISETTADRTDLQDPTVPLFPHNGYNQAGNLNGSMQINFQLTFDFLICVGLSSAGDAEPRVIDQHVNSPEMFNCFFDGIFDLALVRYIQFNEEYLVLVLLSNII